MRIVKAETFQGDGGWQVWSFLKLTTDEGIVGWTDFRGGPLTPLVMNLIERIDEEDPRDVARIDALLAAGTRIADRGLHSHATGAITNACLDIKAKALGVPVADLFGGAIRDRLPAYWSHCGLFRANRPDFFDRELGGRGVRSLADAANAAREAKAAGFKALKTNLLPFLRRGLGSPGGPGAGKWRGEPARNLDRRVLDSLVEQIGTYRDAVGPDVGIMLDLNFNYKAEGFRQIERALAPFRLTWLEMDLYEPKALARIRANAGTAVASLEAIYTRRDLLPYLENRSVDVCIIDSIWNGTMESFRMAAMADAFEVNVAGHTAASPFQALMGAQFCAAIPNFRILEFDADQVPWVGEVFDHPPRIENGELVVSTRPGWGSDINEEALRAHPPRGPAGGGH